jgi:hypothetical protein
MKKPGPGTRDSGIGNRESGIGNRESGIGNRESGIGNREERKTNVVIPGLRVAQRCAEPGLRRQDAGANIGEADGPKGEPRDAASNPFWCVLPKSKWIPAFAGMTSQGIDSHVGWISNKGTLIHKLRNRVPSAAFPSPIPNRTPHQSATPNISHVLPHQRTHRVSALA